jgi:hypothetical protein
MVQVQVQQSRSNRQATPERWQAALIRAIAERVTVRQVNANGVWVATSGTDATMAYLLEVTGGIVHSCTCPAGQFNDPVCKHRARWYFDAGLLDLNDPEPDPPALGATSVVCFRCRGREAGCSSCGADGIASLPAQAAALVADAA